MNNQQNNDMQNEYQHQLELEAEQIEIESNVKRALQILELKQI